MAYSGWVHFMLSDTVVLTQQVSSANALQLEKWVMLCCGHKFQFVPASFVGFSCDLLFKGCGSFFTECTTGCPYRCMALMVAACLQECGRSTNGPAIRRWQGASIERTVSPLGLAAMMLLFERIAKQAGVFRISSPALLCQPGYNAATPTI